MEKSRNILTRMAMLGILLLAMNWLYRVAFHERDIQEHSPIINQVRQLVADSAAMIYLGESSDNTVRGDDTDKRAISGFISGHYPEIPFGVVNKGALHSGIYRVLLEHIPEPANVETVIVTLNLRSFGADWIYSTLETALQKSIVLLKDRPPLLNRFLLSFKGYDVRDDDERLQQVKRAWRKEVFDLPFEFSFRNVIEWDAHIAREGILKDDGTWDDVMTPLAAHYVKTYAFQIDPARNPRIRDFDRIVELAGQRGWNLVFNLMAENTEQAGRLAGGELLYMMRQNRDLLVERYAARGVIVADNLDDVPDEEFIDRNWTTEHYAEQGRKIIAGNVADSLRRIYPEQYRKADYTAPEVIRFCHDCETSESWGQMQTLVRDRAFSGEWSSRTGRGSDFGITFEYDLQSLNDSLKSGVMVSAQVFQEAIGPEARLVVELRGEGFPYFWHAVPIRELTGVTGAWRRIEYEMELPGNTPEAEIIKVYVYNPSGTVVFVDDLCVEF